MEQVLSEVQRTVTCCFGTQDRTAPRHAFAGEHSRMVLTCQLLIHAVEESYLTTAYAYVTGRDILVGTDTTPEFQHERLAETHDLCVRLAYRVEVCSTLGTTHRQRRQGILEGLLESEELEH